MAAKPKPKSRINPNPEVRYLAELFPDGVKVAHILVHHETELTRWFTYPWTPEGVEPIRSTAPSIAHRYRWTTPLEAVQALVIAAGLEANRAAEGVEGEVRAYRERLLREVSSKREHAAAVALAAMKWYDQQGAPDGKA